MPKEKKPLHDYPAALIATELFTHLGLESGRKNGVWCLDDNTVITCAGNAVLYVNVKDGRSRAEQGPEGGGIGAVCVHPTKSLYVVCEKGTNPLVRVHEWPSKRRLHVMKNGAVQGFSACNFNEKGNVLATVAIEPDFVITLWDWQTQSIVLRNKAFGSDVYNVVFNPFNDGLLVTSGLGHIKFWTMAETFTGLKLQGEVGKFGRLDLSDVCASVCLPDGKVVSGCESGSLLLWEGSLVKCELYNTTATAEKQREADEVYESAASPKSVQEVAETSIAAPTSPAEGGTTTEASSAANNDAASSEEHAAPAVEKVKCHNGPIEVLRMIANGKIIMSAGHDGYIRYWSADEIDVAENDGIDVSCGVRMLKEFYVGPDIAINGAALTPSKDCWILQNANGSLVKAPYWSYEVIMTSAPPPDWLAPEPVTSFSAGSLNNVLASPTDHTAVTLGEDGSVRLVDYINAKELYGVKFNAAALTGKFLSIQSGDKEGRTFIASFADGTLRVLRKSQNTFEQASACRPHTERIIDFSVDTESKQVMTISEDGTAFFLHLNCVDFSLHPLGFCQLPARATSCCWTVEGTSCLVSFPNGNIVAVEPPKPGEVDPTVTFEFQGKWSGLGYRQKMKPPEKPKREGIDEEEEEEEDVLEEEDLGPWGTIFITPTPQRTYIIGMDKPELCYDYECKIRYEGREGPTPLPATGIEPPNWVEEPIKNHAFRDTIVIGASTSYSGKFYLCICEHNKLLLRSFAEPDKIIHTTQLHDAIHGKTTAAVLSFDDKVILTSATDGMFFAHKIQDIEPPTIGDAANVMKFPVAQPPVGEGIPRSVEDQKKYEDECKAEEAAQGKKAQTLNRIKTIHEEYEALFRANEDAREGEKLTYEEMMLDPQLYQLLEGELKKAVDDASVEYSWETAKREVALKKLRDVFVDSLQYDHFAVLGFQSKVKVNSFRTPHFTEHQKKALESIQELLIRADDEGEEEEELEGALSSSPSGTKSPRSTGTRTPTSVRSPKTGKQSAEFPVDTTATTEQHADPDQVPMPTLKKETAGTKSAVKSQLEKAEERKRERVHRRQGYQQLMGRRPRQQDDDPKYLQEIIRAEKFMGDFILKTSPEYSIPEHSRPTADRKAKQLILLEHSIVQLKSEFNQRLLAMRDLKQRLCDSLNKDRAKMKEIAKQLNQETEFTPFALVSEELPEQRFDCTRSDLEKFEKEQEKAKRREEAMHKAKKGFGADLAQAEEEPEEEDPQLTQQRSMRQPPMARRGSQMTTLRERTDGDIKARVESVKRSELEEEELSIQREQLLFERAKLERRVNKTIQAFDDSLLELFNEKLRLEADLSMADMRVLLLFREFQMLSEFKKKDGELQRKLDAKKKERQDVLDRREALNERRAAKLGDLRTLNAEMEALLAEYTALITNYPEVKAGLDKIYNRRIKRRRKDEDEDEEDDELSSSDDEEEDFDEEEELADGVEEICPTGCPDTIFQDVLELRERRLDQDEIFQEHNKAEEQVKKELAMLKTKEEKLSNEVRNIEKEVEQFQVEKQHQLNLLTTIVVLKLSQIQCLRRDGKLPGAYGDHIVVFSQKGLKTLRSRIVELAEQKLSKNKEVDQLAHERARILRKKSRKQSEHSDWEAKVYEVQLLKFGQRVDLEMLENVAVDRETEELKEKLKLEELKWEKELGKFSSKLTGLRQDQQARITDNTVLLKDLGSLRAEQHEVEERLSQSTQKVVAKMSGGSKVATAADRAHLKDLVVAQQQEIDALKNEIAMLRRKGGHVYTPMVNTANTRQAQGTGVE